MPALTSTHTAAMEVERFAASSLEFEIARRAAADKNGEQYEGPDRLIDPDLIAAVTRRTSRDHWGVPGSRTSTESLPILRATHKPHRRQMNAGSSPKACNDSRGNERPQHEHLKVSPSSGGMTSLFT